MPGVLWALLFGNFVIGTGVMVVPGTLNEISTSLQVSVATAGQLISAGALLMCLGAPLCAAVVAGWDRRACWRCPCSGTRRCTWPAPLMPSLPP
jgi:predicted MFS family arabinose efflux permease